MNDTSFGGRLLAFLSSLRLAVVTMVALASVCGYATFYEMQNGTPAAQRDIYQTPWFAFLLGLLGLNVFAVLVARWPWSKHQIGFLVAHVGILAILVGSVISLYRGLDSNMVLAEGETTDRVRLPAEALHVAIPGMGVHGVFPVVYETDPPAPGGEKRYGVPGSDIVLVADAWERHVTPAVRLHLESPSVRTEPQWVRFGEHRRVRLGDQVASLSYRQPELALPFRVTLLRFNNEPYPGSRMASTFESTVRVNDPERGSFETVISMNNPLHHRGYIFFQSSFVEGRPMISIFSVARAPGLPLVYLGTTLIGVGIAWMFYVKPWLARRQAARVLEAHRRRESIIHEAKPADPVSAGA